MRGFKRTLLCIAEPLGRARLLRVQLDHQAFVDVLAEFGAVGRALERAGRSSRRPRPRRGSRPSRRARATPVMRSWLFAFSVAATTSPAFTRADGMFKQLAVHRDRAVADELARFGARRAEAHAVDDVVEPRFEQLQQVLAGRALAAAPPPGSSGGTGARGCRTCGASSASRAAACRSRTGACPTSRRAVPGWTRACTWSRAIDARFSGRGRCLPVAPACIWVRYNVPRLVLPRYACASAGGSRCAGSASRRRCC